MTVRFLRTWNGNAEDSIASFSALEESRLIGLGIATATLTAQKSAPVFDSMSEFQAAGGAAANPGLILIGSSQGFSDGASLFQTDLLLINTGTKVTLTGTTTETVLLSVAIPDGAMGPNSSLQIEPHTNWTSSANNKTFAISIGTSVAGSTNIYSRTRTTTGDLPLIRLSNRGVANSQLSVFSGTGTYGSNSSSFLVEGSTSIDFSLQSLNIYFKGTLASGSETLDLNACMVKIINPYL